MEPAIFFVIAIGFIVVVFVISHYQKKAAEKRQADLATLAAHYGFEFYPDGFHEPYRGFWRELFPRTQDSNLGRFLDRFQGFSPFGQGHSWSVTNLAVGRRNGVDWYVFDYLYKTTQSTGKSTTTVPHPIGVVAVRLPIMMPGLSLAPENVLHRVGSFLGVKDIQFELEEFNRRYYIQCSDRKKAFDLLHPQAIEYFMELPVRHWQMGGFYIVLSRANYYAVEEIPELVRELEGFVGHIPDYVQQDAGFQANWKHPLD